MLINLELSADEAPNIIFTIPDDDAINLANDDNDGMGRQGKLLRLAGWIDLDSKVTVSPLTAYNLYQTKLY